MQSKILYLATIGLILLSFYKDRDKTKKSLEKAWKAFENILPQFLGVITLIGIMIAYLDPETISSLIGSSSGWWEYLLCL
ncbi:hypothetical protein K8M07_11305 [Schnuerera sp. xch1]|uniref:hypothetical protein n=1 Tax=Schnuerera sp. xch1 TaxID=2874283 RepID=UPI001CBDD016|nr:hypothetical protein [Schnuerera sp. xch1]MBZ2175824.1 hypothetical protein [Schnuerera sp. xch1]